MCGIAGALAVVATQSESERLSRPVASMTAALAHRGPNDSGSYADQKSGVAVALGHRRLSIIDLSQHAHQPMVDAGTGVTLVYNGELYNFHEIRAELGEEERFASAGDTEVVLRAYVRWGKAAFDRFRGMFAIAIWDPRDGSLLLARDRMGIKPLYYASTGSGAELWFASEVRALLHAGVVPRKLDRRGLSAYLWNGYVPGPSTIVEGVRLLPAGSVLVAKRPRDGRALEIEQAEFAALPAAEQPSSIAELHAELERAVGLQLVSDVPLGVFLSGGVDSSVVAALASRHRDRPVSTFTIGFDEAAYDEAGFAKRVAQHLGTEHHELRLSRSVFASGWRDALAALDQPTFDGINTYFVSRAVRDAGITVALAGTGGDELFGGYSSFRDVPRVRRLSSLGRICPRELGAAMGRGLSRVVLGKPGAVRPQTRFGKLEDVLGAHGKLLDLYQVSHSQFTRRLQTELALTPGQGLESGLDAGLYGELAARSAGLDELSAISEYEIALFLRERLLRDTDCTSMAVSLEVRVPLLDEAVVQQVRRLPSHDRYGTLGRKDALRTAAKGDLDLSIFERRKAGFELPLDVWCRETLRSELSSTLRDINLCHSIGLNAEAVGRVWTAFERGAPGLYWSRVWGLFALLWWCREQDVRA